MFPLSVCSSSQDDFPCTHCFRPNFTAPTETNVYHQDQDLLPTPSLCGALLVTPSVLFHLRGLLLQLFSMFPLNALACLEEHSRAPGQVHSFMSESLFVMCHVSKLANLFLPVPPLQQVSPRL